MNEIFNMVGDSSSIVNFTFVGVHRYQYDLLTWKYEPIECKTKSFIWGKQLRDNT